MYGELTTLKIRFKNPCLAFAADTRIAVFYSKTYLENVNPPFKNIQMYCDITDAKGDLIKGTRCKYSSDRSKLLIYFMFSSLGKPVIDKDIEFHIKNVIVPFSNELKV